jgi:hypothetical protein
MPEHVFDPQEPDGVYGNVETLLFWVQCGAEQLYYRVRKTAANSWLAQYTGFSAEASPQEPQELPPIDEASNSDAWE